MRMRGYDKLVNPATTGNGGGQNKITPTREVTYSAPHVVQQTSSPRPAPSPTLPPRDLPLMQPQPRSLAQSNYSLAAGMDTAWSSYHDAPAPAPAVPKPRSPSAFPVREELNRHNRHDPRDEPAFKFTPRSPTAARSTPVRPGRSTFPPADRILARELMRPPKYGGHSKRDQLGSIAESWGPDPLDPLRVGLFQHEPEPPSPTASPGPL